MIRTVDQLLEDSGRTVITVPRLDAASTARVERFLRDEAHVPVERIAAPRQRLEDLFVKIVEDARKERAETSGAQAGGPTAAFLRGEESEGERLIGDLVAAPDVPETAPATAGPRPAPASPVVPVVPSDSVAPAVPVVPATPVTPVAPAGTPAARPAQKSATDVDRSVIDDLLGGGGGS